MKCVEGIVDGPAGPAASSLCAASVLASFPRRPFRSRRLRQSTEISSNVCDEKNCPNCYLGCSRAVSDADFHCVNNNIFKLKQVEKERNQTKKSHPSHVGEVKQKGRGFAFENLASRIVVNILLLFVYPIRIDLGHIS